MLFIWTRKGTYSSSTGASNAIQSGGMKTTAKSYSEKAYGMIKLKGIEGSKYRIEDDAIGLADGKSISVGGLDAEDLVAAYIKDGKFIVVNAL